MKKKASTTTKRPTPRKRAASTKRPAVSTQRGARSVAVHAGDNQATLVSEISRVAYGLFEQNGYQHGHDAAHWFQATEIVQQQLNVRKRRT